MKNTILSMLKSTFVLTVTSLLLVSCGGSKNTSGGSTNDVIPVNPNGGVVVGGNGQALPPNWRDIIRQENPCMNGGPGSRRVASFPVQVNANVGAMYVGATSEGDIAYIENNNGQITLTVEVCDRADLGNGGQVSSNIVVNNSYQCPIGEISKADLILNGNYGQYVLKLRPIHIPNYGVYSSLCQ